MNNLKKIRLLRGLTQYDLGARMELSQTRIWRIERGYEIPPEEIKESLAEIMKVEVEDLFAKSQKELNTRYEFLEQRETQAAPDEVIQKVLGKPKQIS